MDAYFFFAPNSSSDGSVSPTGKFRFKAVYLPGFNPGPSTTASFTVPKPPPTVIAPIIDNSVVIKPDPVPIVPTVDPC
jgi:hypothetical protein